MTDAMRVIDENNMVRLNHNTQKATLSKYCPPVLDEIQNHHCLKFTLCVVILYQHLARKKALGNLQLADL